MNLKQRTTAEILKDAGIRIALLDKHSALIAECEALTEQLNKAAGAAIFTAQICPHPNTGNLSAWAQTERQRSEVYAAIDNADLMFIGETPCAWDLERTTVHLQGLDVTICAGFESQKFAEAA